MIGLNIHIKMMDDGGYVCYMDIYIYTPYLIMGDTPLLYFMLDNLGLVLIITSSSSSFTKSIAKH